MASCKGFLKYGLFTLNIIFMIYHIVLMLLGLYITFKIQYIKGSIATEVYVYIVIVLITCFILLIVGILGYYGTLRENEICTIMYTILMLLIFGNQVIFLARASHDYKMLADFGYEFVHNIWEKHGTEQQVMDRLQLSFKCCGKNDYDDYNPLNESTPNSCCGEEATYCSAVYAYGRGCQGAFLSTWFYIIDVTIYATFGIAAVELAAIILACCLANQMVKKKKKVISPL